MYFILDVVMFDIINVYFLLIVKALFNKFVYCLYSPFFTYIKGVGIDPKKTAIHW